MPMHHHNAVHRTLGAPQISISSPDDPLQAEMCKFTCTCIILLHFNRCCTFNFAYLTESLKT